MASHQCKTQTPAKSADVPSEEVKVAKSTSKKSSESTAKKTPAKTDKK